VLCIQLLCYATTVTEVTVLHAETSFAGLSHKSCSALQRARRFGKNKYEATGNDRSTIDFEFGYVRLTNREFAIQPEGNVQEEVNAVPEALSRTSARVASPRQRVGPMTVIKAT
jgi:hypothetical protein